VESSILRVELLWLKMSAADEA
jgi:hypothetical protein